MISAFGFLKGRIGALSGRGEMGEGTLLQRQLSPAADIQHSAVLWRTPRSPRLITSRSSYFGIVIVG